WKLVDGAALGLGAQIGGGGELSLRQTINAIVFDQGDNRHIAAHDVAELTETDTCGITIPTYADLQEVLVGHRASGGHRRHATVHGVESVSVREEISRRFAGAADAAQLGDAVRLDAQLEASFDDLARDRVVPAAIAQR